MSYYAEIVSEYLQARGQFIRREFFIALDKTPQQAKGRSWYVDVLAVDFGERTIWLCEVSFAKTLYALRARFKQWSDNWELIQQALRAEIAIGTEWQIRPWAFTPEELKPVYESGLQKIGPLAFDPKWSTLEDTAPWRLPAGSTLRALARTDLSAQDRD